MPFIDLYLLTLCFVFNALLFNCLDCIYAEILTLFKQEAPAPTGKNKLQIALLVIAENFYRRRRILSYP